LNKTYLSKYIRNKALDIGFSKIGFTSPDIINHNDQHLLKWIDKKFHGQMNWIENRIEERLSIKKYYPEVKSIISVGLNYFTGNANNVENTGKISNYAWGDDYHLILKSHLYNLLDEIKKIEPNIHGVVCVDTSPIMEKEWAQKSGIGWVGKNTNIITTDFGSWIFLGELLINFELDYDSPFLIDHCGSCTACLDACPTDAFPQPYVLDSNKCISYLTIEFRGDFENIHNTPLNNWIYGCDICQEVCPWNISFSQISTENRFLQRNTIVNKKFTDWLNLDQKSFNEFFKNSPVKRTKYKGLLRNIKANLANKN
tara:strand:- start:1006 stop:1944 length:939 start_codon:yes stop_codon:yes gene_type:complete